MSHTHLMSLGRQFLMFLCCKFEVEEKMFRNDDEEEEDENKPPAHDGPPKSPSGESATILTATNIPAEPVNHDRHRLHLRFHPIGNHPSPVGGSSNIHPNNVSAESPTYNRFKLPSLVPSSHQQPQTAAASFNQSQMPSYGYPPSQTPLSGYQSPQLLQFTF